MARLAVVLRLMNAGCDMGEGECYLWVKANMTGLRVQLFT